jgi:hypothetical protein
LNRYRLYLSEGCICIASPLCIDAMADNHIGEKILIEGDLHFVKSIEQLNETEDLECFKNCFNCYVN